MCNIKEILKKRYYFVKPNIKTFDYFNEEDEMLFVLFRKFVKIVKKIGVMQNEKNTFKLCKIVNFKKD